MYIYIYINIYWPHISKENNIGQKKYSKKLNWKFVTPHALTKRMEIIIIFRNYSWFSGYFLGHVQLTVHNLCLIPKSKVTVTFTWNLYLSVKHLNCLVESATERDNYHFICLEWDSWNICNGAEGLILFIRDYIQRNQEKQTINLRHLLFNKSRPPFAYHQQPDAVTILSLYLQSRCFTSDHGSKDSWYKCGKYREFTYIVKLWPILLKIVAM